MPVTPRATTSHGVTLDAHSVRESEAPVDAWTTRPVVTRERLLVASTNHALHRVAERVAAVRALELLHAATAAEALRLAPEADAAVLCLRLARNAPFREHLGRLHPSLPLAVAGPVDVDTHLALARSGIALVVDTLEEGALAAGVQKLLAARPRPARVLVLGPPDEAQAAAAALAGAGHAPVLVDRTESVPGFVDEVRPEALWVTGPDAVDLVRLVRTRVPVAELPVLAATSATDAAFEAGADAIVPGAPTVADVRRHLDPRLRRARVLRDRAERDSLTGLLLRAPAIELVQARLAEASRRSERLAIALIDLDRFKTINDRYGHLAGDRVLAAVGRLFGERLRPTDVRGRWGGEEFLVALPGEDTLSAAPVLDRLLDALAEVRFADGPGLDEPISFSAGLAGFPDDGDEIDALLRVADDRCYRAKALGGARIVTAG